MPPAPGSTPTDRRYAPTHEWHKPEGDLVLVGISAFAVEELTDITYVDVTHVEGPIKAGEPFGEIESVKATSELYAGVDGEVVAINEEVIDNPALINEDPYEQGWLIKLRPSDPSQLDGLLSGEDYDKQHAAGA